MKTHYKQMWLGIAISLILVAVLWHSTDTEQLAQAFRRVNYLYCFPVILVSFAGILVRAYRWKFIMQPLHQASFANLFSSTMIGFMANFVLPARLGEIIRAYWIGKKERITKSASFATIVVERLFDVFMILLILCLVLIWLSLPGRELEPTYMKALRAAGITLTVLFVVALTLLILLKQKTQSTVGWIRFVLRPLPDSWKNRLDQILESFAVGLGAIQLNRQLIWILVYSGILWGIYALGNGLMLSAFQIQLPGFVPFYLLVIQAIGVAVPSSPGFVGTYHAAVVAGLAALKVPQEMALSFAILSHLLMIVPVILAGLVLLWRDGVSLHALQTQTDSQSRTAPEELTR